LGNSQVARDAVHAAQIERAGAPGPRAIGIDEISIRKGRVYRIVVSDLVRKEPIWFGGEDRSEASMAQFYAWLGRRKCSQIRLVVMDMWKPFRNAAMEKAPQAAILFDKFRILRISGMPSTRSARRNTPASAARTGASSRPEVHAAVASKNLSWRQAFARTAAGRQTSASTPPTS